MVHALEFPRPGGLRSRGAAANHDHPGQLSRGHSVILTTAVYSDGSETSSPPPGHAPPGSASPADVGSIVDLWLGSRLVESEFFGSAASE